MHEPPNMPVTRAILASGHRLKLARFLIDDLQAVHEFASDPLVCRYTLWGPNHIDETKEFLNSAVQELPNSLTLAVLRGNEVIGSAAVWVVDENAGLGELGYTLHSAHWGRGYATEVAGLLCHLGLNTLGLHRLSATGDARNAASIRVLEKSGFVLAERRQEQAEEPEGREETLVYELAGRD